MNYNAFMFNQTAKRATVRACVLGAMAITLSTAAQATLIATDSFLTTNVSPSATRYSTAVNSGRLYGANPSESLSGFTGPWTNSTALATNDLLVRTNSLTHPLLVGTPTLHQGLASFANGTSTRTATRAFSSFDTGLSEYFFSALVLAPETPTSTNPARMGLGQNVGQADNPASGIHVGVDDAMIRLYYKNTSGTFVSSNALTSVTANTTYMFVVHLELNVSGTDDRITLSIYNPSAAWDSPTVSISVLGSVDPATEMQYLVFNKANLSAYTAGNTPQFDEFRFGTELDDVILIPEPGTFTLVAAGLFCGIVILRQRHRRPAGRLDPRDSR